MSTPPTRAMRLPDWVAGGNTNEEKMSKKYSPSKVKSGGRILADAGGVQVAAIATNKLASHTGLDEAFGILESPTKGQGGVSTGCLPIVANEDCDFRSPTCS